MMNTASMNKIALMGLMVIITIVGMGKIISPFFGDESAVLPTTELVSETSLLVAAIKPQQEDWITHWLHQDIIPSAEAAEGIQLKEEKLNTKDDVAQVIEMRKKQSLLDTREKSLDEREAMVKEAEQRAESQIAKLVQLEARIQSILKEENSIKDKKIKRLTAVYEGMKAERAAPVIAQMELDIVVKIFSRMSEKQVGKILSFLSPKQAVVISHALTQRIASVR